MIELVVISLFINIIRMIAENSGRGVEYKSKRVKKPVPIPGKRGDWWH